MKNKLIVFLSVWVGSVCGYTYYLPEFYKEGECAVRIDTPGQQLRWRSYKNREIEQFVSAYFTILEEFLATHDLDDEKVAIEKFFALLNSLEEITKQWTPGMFEFYKIPPMSTERIQRNLIFVLKEEWRKFIYTSSLVVRADKTELKGKLTRLVNYPSGSKAYKLFYGFLNRTRLP